MADFVQGRAGSINELKLPTTKPGTSKTSKSSKQKSRGLSKTPSQNDLNERDRSEKLELNHEYPRYYDTDASQADATSTAPSTVVGEGNLQGPVTPHFDVSRKDHSQVLPARVTHSQGEDLHRLNRVSNASPRPGDQAHHFGSLPSPARHQNQQFDRTHATGPHGFPHVEGDSYPATSSRHSSNGGDDLRERDNVMGPPPPKPLELRPNAQVIKNTFPNATNSPRLHSKTSSFGTSQAFGMNQTLENINQGFERPQAPTMGRKPPPQNGVDETRAASMPQAPYQPAQQSQRRTVLLQGEHSHTQHRQDARPVVQDPFQQVPRESRIPQPHQQHHQQYDTGGFGQMQTAPSGAGEEYVTSAQRQHRQDVFDEGQATLLPTQPSPAMDYSPEVLPNMKFAELQAQPFDFVPGAQQAEVNLDSSQKIADRMDEMSHRSQNDQREFFAKLPIDEWEDAGDWFLARFGDVMSDLKKARRDKRQVTQEFEAEIKKRHDVVSTKRSITDEAMQQIRKSGGEILQNTPQKTRGAK